VKHLLAAAAALMLACAPAHAGWLWNSETQAKAQGPWAVYQPEGVGFAVELPGEWNVETQNATSPAGNKFKMYMARVTVGRKEYGSAHAFISAIAPRVTVTAMLDAMRDSAVANTDGKLRSEEKVLVSNLPGRQIIVELPRGNVVVSMRFFLLDNVMITVTAAGAPGIESDPDTLRMLQSLKVVRKP
jgi:hypothetical protein